MGHKDVYGDSETRSRLLETAKAMVLRGDNGFSVASVCMEAGVDRDAFRAHFSGRTALMASLMQTPGMADFASQRGASCEPLSELVSKAVPESSVSTPDAWLERRLRVFERALNALEAKAETVARDHARAIALLEERLNAANNAPAAVAPVPALLQVATAAQEPAAMRIDAKPAPAKQDTHWLASQAEQGLVEEPPPEAASAVAVTIETSVAEVSAQDAPAMEAPESEALMTEENPLPPPAANKEELAGMLQSVREKTRIAVESQEPEPDNSTRTRWLVVGAVSLVALLLCVGISLGKNVLGAPESDGMTHRQVASTRLAQTTALADAGDPRAQARLALAYLRGQGAAGDANAALLWTRSAAQAGNPVAQYLMGALYQQGDRVTADPVMAFNWFARAAEKGNLKAMHNLAIAYAQGMGTAKDEAKAAEWFTRAAERGYVDSAFDLAVLYERGTGVPQDLKQALKWYGIAAMAGDAPAKERADFLHGQMKAADIKLANAAAMAFAPLPALDTANNL